MGISVEITGTQEEQLAEIARRLNVAPDALASAALRDLLAQREPDFLAAATRILEKNRDLRALESAVAQPRMTFGGRELYPTLEEKAAAIGFSLISSHPFIDGNNRVGHAAMETFLRAHVVSL